jgi:hypothetical protein
MEEGAIKKTWLFFVILGFLVLSLAGVSYGWQGRMAGMDDPFGLVDDESDFLIHPAKIAKVEKLNFYSDYRFEFRDVPDWNYSVDYINTTTRSLMAYLPYNSSGDERGHEITLGAALPWGPGKMGFFFQYKGNRNDYHGDRVVQSPIYIPSDTRFGMKDDLDSIALRILYGIPVAGFDLGGEVQLAYYNEKKETRISDHESGAYYLNLPIGGGGNFYNLFPFMRPYDSKYWEAVFKSSLERGFGPAKFTFTLGGGVIFSGSNSLMFGDVNLPETGGVNFDGNVKGWNIGGDLWVRYSLQEDVSLPFLLRIKYQTKTRDGDGFGIGSFAGEASHYSNRENDFQLEVGGGIERKLLKDIKFAGGIYYVFSKNRNNFLFRLFSASGLEIFDQTKYPDQVEHQVIIRLAGEKELSPMVTIRSGLEFFYGRVTKDYESPWGWPETESVDGPHWGMKVSVGGTLRFEKFSVEPFLGVGYQKWNLDGTGSISALNVLGNFTRMNEERKEWFTGGGFSVKF